MSIFQKATKRAVRARIALDGPSGSGKTWTALTFAAVLGKRVAAVDTERASMALYSDRFDFDVIEMSPPFHPDRLVEAIRSAEKEGYEVLVIDSLSHFWEGEGGVLDIVDAAGQRAHGNTYAGWKTGSPVLRHLIDAILASDLHVIATMRSKQEYVLEEDDRGRKVPRKVGMAPVMRSGVEFEFTVVGDLDIEHRLTISKSRADVLADQVIQPGRAGEAAEAFLAWVNAGAPIASRAEIDALKQSFNQIGDHDLRLAAKRAFGDQFGNPDYLLADKIEAARAFVAGYADPSPSSPPPDGEGTAGVEAGDRDGGRGGTAQAAPTMPPSAPKDLVTSKEAQRLHVLAGNKNDTGSPLDPHVLDVLVFGISGGATDSTAGLTKRQAGRLEAEIAAARAGNLPADFGAVEARYADWLDERDGVAS